MWQKNPTGADGERLPNDSADLNWPNPAWPDGAFQNPEGRDAGEGYDDFPPSPRDNFDDIDLPPQPDIFDPLWDALDKLWEKWKEFSEDTYEAIKDGFKDLFDRARIFIPVRDPLVLDLDGDGIETVAATGAILFDHDGDGVRSGTGWVAADDGLLVLDRNGNGLIDNGGELFGADTVLADGSKATSGFAALADMDSNEDGVFDAEDIEFGNVRVWRDLNQDGVSQAGELFT